MGVSGWVKVLKKSLRNSGNIHYPGWSVGPVTAGPRALLEPGIFLAFEVALLRCTRVTASPKSPSFHEKILVFPSFFQSGSSWACRLQRQPKPPGKGAGICRSPYKAKTSNAWRHLEGRRCISQRVKMAKASFIIYPFGQSQRDKNMEHHEPSMKHENLT